MIEKTIEQFVTSYKHSTETVWRKPLIAYASTSDLLFLKLYFIPFQEQVILNNKKGRYSSETRAVSIYETTKLIGDLNHHLEDMLAIQAYCGSGNPAQCLVAPQRCLYS